MSGPVFDSYAVSQSSGTTIPFDPSWGPTSQRALSATGVGNSMDVNSGQLNVTLAASGSCVVSYLYPPPGVDLSTLPSISLNFNGVTTLAVSLSLSDISNTMGTFKPTIGGMVTWPLSPYTMVDKTKITQIDITIATSPFANPLGNYIFDDLSSQSPCVAENTQILMLNGSKKSIQEIKRGDIVAGDPDFKKNHMVARLNVSYLHCETPIDIIKVRPGTFGENVPNQSLIITANHPIIYGHERKPAKCFIKFPGVTHYKKIRSKDLINVPGQLNLYDLQFDHDGTYVANGVTVQSKCPRSESTPLPKELYFDHNLYTNETTWDSYDHDLPFNDDPLNPPV
jgi:hypothetical protein